MQEFFAVYQDNRLAGILRDDFTSLFLVVMYLGTFPALYVALRRVNAVGASLATLFTLVAVTTCFATHSGFSLIHLSDQYAAATTDAQRAQLLAAGEAVLATDMWNSSGAYLSGLLMQGGGIIISLVMLRHKGFSKVTAFAGILGNGSTWPSTFASLRAVDLGRSHSVHGPLLPGLVPYVGPRPATVGAA